ncbi:MAG: Mo-dependent nitrogenase C-terminal domain-containing protein [Nostocales cyanobacterium 94392]|nr:Mo-dependent nitrogenase C-terminal domain-containing protein [Nostocales cyanobacterium 94392]
MKVFNNTTRKIFLASWVLINQEIENQGNLTQQHNPGKKFRCDVLKPLRLWIDNIEVRDRQFAHRVCRVIPAQCPFERDVNLFGRTLFHIPPMCKLNPLYEEVVALRFRSLCYLADECGEDISQYC